MTVLYAFVLLALSSYSYTLADPNLVLVNSPVWIRFQQYMLYIGRERTLLAYIYFLLLLLLFVFHIKFMKKVKEVDVKKVAVTTAGILFFSYPFLSRDIFNYLFYSKILTYYHANPFSARPLDFPQDELIRFVFRPELSTLYGPSFVLLSAIPSFLSFGNFLASYVLFKLLIAGSYLSGVYILSKWKKEWAVFFATSPLILVEGLINLHNDLLALTITLGGLYLLFHNKGWTARAVLLFSGLIKYGTLPLVFISRDKKSIYTWFSALGILAVLLYACFRGMQPWYLLVLFTMIPYWFDKLRRFQFFYFGSLLGYVYYIEHDDWRLAFFYLMIFGSLVINFIYNTTNGFFLRRDKKK